MTDPRDLQLAWDEEHLARITVRRLRRALADGPPWFTPLNLAAGATGAALGLAWFALCEVIVRVAA